MDHRPTPFWLRPRWIVGHILCLALVVLFVNLGLWQLRRLDDRRDRNALIESRMDAPPAAIDDVLDGSAPDQVVYRRVRATGTWDAAATVLVRSRSLDDRPGYHVLTPLVVGDSAIIVNRGFTPLGGGGEDAVLDAVRPPVDEATVEGILRPTETRGSIGPTDPAEGTLDVVNRVDIDRLQRQVDRPLESVFLQLREPAPPSGELPLVLPLPNTDEGPHLAYAVQWFLFATVGAVGWPLLLRRTARDEPPD